MIKDQGVEKAYEYYVGQLDAASKARGRASGTPDAEKALILYNFAVLAARFDLNDEAQLVKLMDIGPKIFLLKNIFHLK
jgi:hypothetical protein